MFRKRAPYPSDLTDVQWQVLKPHLPPPADREPKRAVDLREIVKLIFYVLHTRCPWDYLPHDFPPTDTVYGYSERSREYRKRRALKQFVARPGPPSSQKASPRRARGLWISQGVGSSRRPKRVARKALSSGRGEAPQQHILVDTLGLVLCVVVHSAQVQDRDGARLVFERILAHFPGSN